MLRLACRVTAILLAAASVALAVEAGTSPNLKVSYDKEKDSLSVEARSSSLRELLAAIGQKGGFVPRVDQEAEKPVSIKFAGLTLEQGLGYIGEETSLNYVLFVSREPVEGKDPVRRISGMYVVYAGKGVAAPAHQPSAVAAGTPAEAAPRPVQAIASPAATTSSQHSPEELDAMRADATRERMEKRLAKLPPEEREKKIKAEEDRLRRNRERMLSISNAQQERRKTILEEGVVDPSNP